VAFRKVSQLPLPSATHPWNAKETHPSRRLEPFLFSKMPHEKNLAITVKALLGIQEKPNALLKALCLLPRAFTHHRIALNTRI
jgi:hypothetical protein